MVSSGTAIKVVWFPLRGDKTRIDFCYCNGSLKLGPFVSEGDFELLFWNILTFKLRKPFENFQQQTTDGTLLFSITEMKKWLKTKETQAEMQLPSRSQEVSHEAVAQLSPSSCEDFINQRRRPRQAVIVMKLPLIFVKLSLIRS